MGSGRIETCSCDLGEGTGCTQTIHITLTDGKIQLFLQISSDTYLNLCAQRTSPLVNTTLLKENWGSRGYIFYFASHCNSRCYSIVFYSINIHIKTDIISQLQVKQAAVVHFFMSCHDFFSQISTMINDFPLSERDQRFWFVIRVASDKER